MLLICELKHAPHIASKWSKTAILGLFFFSPQVKEILAPKHTNTRASLTYPAGPQRQSPSVGKPAIADTTFLFLSSTHTSRFPRTCVAHTCILADFGAPSGPIRSIGLFAQRERRGGCSRRWQEASTAHSVVLSSGWDKEIFLVSLLHTCTETNVKC